MVVVITACVTVLLEIRRKHLWVIAEIGKAAGKTRKARYVG
jgi:hypothetical protein